MKSFVVEGSVSSEATETPETLDVGDYVFSENINFPQLDARFGSKALQPEIRQPPCIGKRALSIYQQVSKEDTQVKLITYFPLSHYPDPDLYCFQ